jgi:hypothetical protein
VCIAGDCVWLLACHLRALTHRSIIIVRAGRCLSCQTCFKRLAPAYVT